MTGFVGLRTDRPAGRGSLLVSIIGPVLVAGLMTLVAGFVQIVTHGTDSDIVILFGINAVMVVGLQAFIGNTGIVSFGHVAFMGVGAYAAGIVSVPVTLKSVVLPSLPHFLSKTALGTLPSIAIAGVTAAVVAFVAGLAIMRLSGAAASIATLGLLVIVNNVLSNYGKFTRGPQAFFGVPVTANFAWVFGMLVFVTALAAWLKWSAVGLRARAVRDDPVAAEASGVRRVRSRLWPFVFSAFVTGIGGALYALHFSSFAPTDFYVPQIVVVLAMAIVGGMNSISGVIVGATLISFLTEILRRIENGVHVGPVSVHPPPGFPQAVLGICLIVVLRWRTVGLFGASEVELDPRPKHASSTTR